MYPQQPQYPAQQPQFPVPQPPQGYPPQPDGTHPPQQPYAYPQPPQYQQPPQPYAQPMPPVQTPSVPGTLDQFYSQPSTGGGKSLAFVAPGQSYVGIVTRPVGNSDITQQTDTQGRGAFFRDGRPKFVMKVPLQMQPSAEYPDGLAQWYVKGAARDELVRAMAEAGAPEGPPEANSVITITMTGTRPSGAGMNPTKLFQVQYRRPQGAPSVAPPALQAQPATPAPVAAVAYQPAPPPVYATNGGTTTNGGGVATIGYSEPTAPPAPINAPASVVASPPPTAAPPVELNADQQALLAKLTGQPA